MAPRVLLLGATGYSGRLVAARLAAAGIEFVAGARDVERARTAMAALGLGSVPIVAVDLTRPDQVADLITRETLVLNCVGPFGLFGRPVTRAVVERGATYLDVAGEERFVADSFRDLDTLARASGALLVHACAFESLPADLLAGAATRHEDGVDRVVSFYRHFHPAISPGTRLTARLASVMRGAAPVEGVTEPTADPVEDVEYLPLPARGTVAVFRAYPEIHFWRVRFKVREAASFLLVDRSTASMVNAARPRERSVEEVLAWHARTARPGPSTEQRRRNRFELSVLVRFASGRRTWACMAGSDPYGLSAAILVWACAALLSGDRLGRMTGVRAPGEVFDFDDFEREARGWASDVSIRRGLSE